MSPAPEKPGTLLGLPSQLVSNTEPQRAQTPVCAVTSERGLMLLESLLLLVPYTSWQPAPWMWLLFGLQVQPLLMVRKACFRPEAPICWMEPFATRYMFQTRNGCWSLL